jgi:hypothetical protein
VVGRHVLAVQPVRRDQIRITGHRIQVRHSQVHVVVFAAAKLLVEGAGRQQAIAPVHHGRVHADEVASEQLHVRRFPRRLETLPDLASIAVDIAMPTVDEAALRRAAETGKTGGDRMRFQSIVRVEKHHVVGVERRQPDVPRGSEPTIVLPDQTRGGKARGDRRRIVCRSVIDHHHIVCRSRLRKDALERLLEETGVVVCRDDHADGHDAG